MKAPRKAPAHRLEGAPPYVIAVYDDGPKVNDRYTVLFGWPLWQPELGREIPCLHFNEAPAHPAVGYSLWGEVSGRWGAKMISWSDLPEHLQQHVIARANYPDKIQIGRLVKVGNGESIWLKQVGTDRKGAPKYRTITRRPSIWGFEPENGVGYFGPTFDSKSDARTYAAENQIVLLRTSK